MTSYTLDTLMRCSLHFPKHFASGRDASNMTLRSHWSIVGRWVGHSCRLRGGEVKKVKKMASTDTTGRASEQWPGKWALLQRSVVHERARGREEPFDVGWRLSRIYSRIYSTQTLQRLHYNSISELDVCSSQRRTEQHLY